jgi:hypothetical protein
LSAAIKAPMLAIDFAKVENKHQYHLELLVPHLLQLLFS